LSAFDQAVVGRLTHSAASDQLFTALASLTGGAPNILQRLRKFRPKHRDRAPDALRVALRPAKAADRHAMPAGQQPVVEFPDELRMKNRHRLRAIKQAH
jgi:hypothetical protein